MIFFAYIYRRLLTWRLHGDPRGLTDAEINEDTG